MKKYLMINDVVVVDPDLMYNLRLVQVLEFVQQNLLEKIQSKLNYRYFFIFIKFFLKKNVKIFFSLKRI